MTRSILARSLSCALVLAGACAAFAVHAAEPSDAELLSREFLRARLAEAARSQKEEVRGVMVTPEGMIFLDGPRVPLEWVEWTEPAAVRRMRRPVVTDTVVRVGPGFTLQLVNLAGDIAVETWPRNEVRIVAEHDRADRIVSALEKGQLKLGVENREEQPSQVEWKLTVPVWLPLQLSGVEGDIDVTGMRSSVRAQTMRGDVNVRSCQGSLVANSIEGEVHVSDVDGNVTANSVNNLIRLFRVTGPVDAQTVNGDIQLERLVSPTIDASSVNGQVLVASPFRKLGRYAFSSHNGRVLVAVPDGQNVNVSLSSFNGEVESMVPLPEPPEAPGAPKAPKAHKLKSRSMRFVIRESPAPEAAPAPRAVRMGDPVWVPEAPQLELESFGGLIQLASQAEVLRAIEMQRVALDSARAEVLRSRREESRLRRALREAQRVQRTPKPAPTPPPPGEH